MKITCLAVDKLRTRYYRDAVDDYASRLQHYVDFEEKEVKPVRGRRSTNQVKDLEAERLVEAVPEGAVVVLLDEHGAELKSRQLAELVDQFRFESRDLCFVIGGSDGHGATIRQNADRKIALSRMTLPHELARVVLVEQLYRAMTILRGEQYHK